MTVKDSEKMKRGFCMDSLINQLKKALARKATEEEIKTITDELFHRYGVVEISFGDQNVRCGPEQKKAETKTTESRK